MKKIQFLLLIITILFSNCILSQETSKNSTTSNSKGFYVDISVGYAHKMSTENLANSFEMYNMSTEDDGVHFEAMHISLGQGTIFGGAAGYMFN